jgi:DNA-binding response OmpR family regulator
MSPDLAGKRVLVLSDNNGLSRVIEFSLENDGLEVIKSVSGSWQQGGWQSEVADVDLIIVAMSSPASQPAAALARASVAGRVGQVPLLLISDRPFHSDSEDQIAHLDFPFEIDGLCNKVEEILLEEKKPGFQGPG